MCIKFLHCKIIIKSFKVVLLFDHLQFIEKKRLKTLIELTLIELVLLIKLRVFTVSLLSYDVCLNRSNVKYNTYQIPQGRDKNAVWWTVSKALYTYSSAVKCIQALRASFLFSITNNRVTNVLYSMVLFL